MRTSSAALLQRVRGTLGKGWLRLQAPRRRASGYVRLGSAYGGWWVPGWIISPGALAYSAGVGEDTSFDVELAARGVQVVCFDPTPRAVAHVASHVPEGTLEFEPIGWWDQDCDLQFFVPRDPAHVSHSAVNLQRTSDFFMASAERPTSVRRRRGEPVPDLVKMDIEGAEYRVLPAMISDGFLPRVLCVEFNQPVPLRLPRARLRELRAVGYTVESVEDWNVTLVRRP